MSYPATASDVRVPAIIIFIVSLVIGGIFWRWPGVVAQHEQQMRSFFASPESHQAFIKVCGYFLLCLAGALLLAVLFS